MRMRMQPEDIVILIAVQKIYFDSLPPENGEAGEALDLLIRDHTSLLNRRVEQEPVLKTMSLK